MAIMTAIDIIPAAFPDSGLTAAGTVLHVAVYWCILHIIFQAISLHTMAMVNKKEMYQVMLFNALVTCYLTFSSLLSANSCQSSISSLLLPLSLFLSSFSMRTEVSACIIWSCCSLPSALTGLALLCPVGAIPLHSLGLCTLQHPQHFPPVAGKHQCHDLFLGCIVLVSGFGFITLQIILEEFALVYQPV
jgi:hypothetical protein